MNSAGGKYGGKSSAIPLQTIPYLYGKAVFVDGINGNDGTAQKGNINKPYKTITAAKTASQSGDIIFVFPALYEEFNLLKNGVNYYFHEGAIVKPVNPLAPIFNDMATGGMVKSSILGRGEFLNQGYATNDTSAIIGFYNGTDLYIEAKTVSGFECWGAGAKITFKGVRFTWEIAIYNNGFAQFKDCFFDNSVNIFGLPPSCKARVENCKFYNTSFPAGYAFSNALLRGVKNIMMGVTTAALSFPNLHIKNSDFYSSDSNILVSTQNYTGNQWIITLDGCRFFSANPAKFCIEAPVTGNAQFKLFNNRSNVGLGGGAVFTNLLNGEGLTVDPNLETYFT